jgi:hypothetical protein
LIYLLSGGGFFFNIVTANVNPFFWGTVMNNWRDIREHMGYLVASSILFALGGMWLKQKAWWVAAPYLLAATLSGITIGKDGSNVNYLYELAAALAFMAGAVLALPGPAWKGTKWVGQRWWLKAVLVILLALQVNAIYPWARDHHSRWELERVANEKEDIARMVELARSAENPVLADEFMGLVVLGGKPLVFQPFEYKQLSIASVWDQGNFINDIFDKKFDYIFLFDPPTWDSEGARWTQLQLDAIQGNYREIERLANTRILVPRDPIDFGS